MRLNVEALLIGITNLFLIWLYTTNKIFRVTLNKFFYRLLRIYRHSRESFPKGIRGLLIVVAVISFFFALLSSGDTLSTFGRYFIFFILAIPLSSYLAKLLRQSSFDATINQIRYDYMEVSEVIKIRDAIKDYFVRLDENKRQKKDEVDLLLALKNFMIYLVHPRIWQRRLIPKITAVPMLSGLFYYSPHNIRFDEKRQIMNSIHRLVRHHPYRLDYQNSLFDDDFMLVTFDNTRKNTLARARSLARRLEQNHKLNTDSILVQDHNDTCKLFIPLIKQDQDS